MRWARLLKATDSAKSTDYGIDVVYSTSCTCENLFPGNFVPLSSQTTKKGGGGETTRLHWIRTLKMFPNVAGRADVLGVTSFRPMKR